MRAVLAALLLVACGGSEPAAPPPTPAAPAPPSPPAPTEPAALVVPADDPSFYACTVATDCVIVPGVCGASVAAAAAHAAEVTAIQSELATRARCAAPPTSVPPIPMRAECQEGRCVAVPDVMAES